MKNATFRQLRVFEAVARHLSYSRAAEELRMSQPGASIQVKQLEKHAALPLFEQLGKKIYLTPAGHEMLRYSRAIIQQFRESRRGARRAKRDRRRHAQYRGDQRRRLFLPRPHR